MLCTKLYNYTEACKIVAGGISNILIFDPADFNFTQAAPNADGTINPYTAIALNAGATAAAGAKMLAISFKNGQAQYTWNKNADTAAYEHTLNLTKRSVAGITLTNFLMSLDAATECCGIGVIIRTNDNKIFVMGEKYVNNSEIIGFNVRHGASTGDSGQAFSDASVANIQLIGSYSRLLNEYTGTWASVEALK